MVAAATICLAGCGGQPAPIPSRPGTTGPVDPPPPPRHDNVGSGRLHGTRFAVPPVVSVFTCTRSRRECVPVTYAVFARLTRDIPRRPAGQIAAAFEVAGLGEGDPIGRMSRPGFCFEQGVHGSGYLAAGAPTRPGASVTVTLTAYDRDGRTTGEISTSVRLRRGRFGSAHDLGKRPEQQAVGC